LGESNGHGGKRANAGRKALNDEEKSKPKTKAIRVPVEVSKAECEALPSVKSILKNWREECEKNPDGARYYFLRQALDDFKELGL
jgi:hypothetical protein